MAIFSLNFSKVLNFEKGWKQLPHGTILAGFLLFYRWRGWSRFLIFIGVNKLGVGFTQSVELVKQGKYHFGQHKIDGLFEGSTKLVVALKNHIFFSYLPY
jgi:hypothetical protein